MERNFAICLFLLLLPVLALRAQPGPNVVFILSDDQRWDALGYQGNELIHTPNLDRLAEEGVYFRNAFVTTPICAASRASIILGRYERSHGYTFQQPPVSSETLADSYFSKLRQSGYYVGFIGKLGVLLEEHADTLLFDHLVPLSPPYWKSTDTPGDSNHLTEITRNKAVQFIREAPEGRPFHLSISFNAPHAEDPAEAQYFWPTSVDTLYRDTKIPEPPMSSESFFLSQPEYVRSGFNRERWYWRFNEPGKYQEMVKGYYRMISAVDLAVRDIRQALIEKGVSDNTVIVYMSDNGYFLGERQLAGKWLLYEPSIRVPLIIYDPRRKKHRDVDQLVTNLDIAPTLLEYASIKLPDSYQGISLASFTGAGRKVAQRENFLCEHLWKFEHIPSSEGIRTKRFKYFRYADHPDHEELYDLKKDPEETRNRITEKRYSRILTELRNETDRLIENSRTVPRKQP